MTNQQSIQAQVNEVTYFATWLAGALFLLWVGKTVGGMEKRFVNDVLDIATPEEIPVRLPQTKVVGGMELAPQTGTYYTISFQGDTTLKPGEIVSEQAFKAENERVTKLGLRPAKGWVTSKGELLSWRNGWRPPEELEEYLPASIPRDDLMKIADKYGWWAAKLAEAVCPHNDVACVEREARRLAEARRARLEA